MTTTQIDYLDLLKAYGSNPLQLEGENRFSITYRGERKYVRALSETDWMETPNGYKVRILTNCELVPIIYGGYSFFILVAKD